MPSIRVGVIGYGNAAKTFHLPFINALPVYEVVAILQRAEAPIDPQSAAPGSHCTVDYPKVIHYTTAESFFANPDIDFVVVATHTDTHALFAKKALESGKHVIVDKPFARSADEADEVIKVANRTGKLVTCFQNRRWDGDFQTVRNLVRDNALGEVKEAEIHYDFESPSWLKYLTEKKYTPGSGLAFGLGTHSLDHAVQLFGIPKSVTAIFQNQRGIESEIEDSFTILLQYDGAQKDLLVTVKTSVITPMARQLKYWLRGTKGSFIKFQQRSTCPQEEQIAEGIKPDDPNFGAEPRELEGILTTYQPYDESIQEFDEKTKKYTGQYPSIMGRWIGLYENVADAINGKAELHVKASESRNVLRLIELARESAGKGATVAWR